MFVRIACRAFLALMFCSLFAVNGWALILIGGSGPISDVGLPAGSAKLANLPTRFSYWEGPPYGGGNYHFEYAGNTAQFQTALDTFAAIQAPRLELFVYDGATTSSFSNRQMNWEFEVWNSASFFRLNHPSQNIVRSISPWFGQPLPPPRLSVFVGDGKPVDWSAIHVPGKVTLLDRRVATSPWASSDFGVVHAVVRDMATSQPLSGVTLEVGSYDGKRKFQPLAWGTTNDAGDVVVDNLPGGSYLVRLRRAGYATREIGYYRNYGHTLGVFDPVSLAPASALKGRVTDPAGQPVAGATVGVMDLIGLDGTGYLQNLYNEQTTTTTDAHGRFTLAPLPRGRVSLMVGKSGLHYFSFETHAIPGEDVKIVMTRAGMIQGRVVGPGGKPAARSLMVEIAPRGGNKPGSWGGSTRSREDGGFDFNGIPPGEYILSVHANPMRQDEVSSKSVTIEGGLLGVDIPWYPAGVARGR